jgi:hypothetical protein
MPPSLQVDAELQAYHAANAEMDAMIGRLRGDIDGLQAAAAATRLVVKQRQAALDEFHSDLHDAMGEGLKSKDGACSGTRAGGCAGGKRCYPI